MAIVGLTTNAASFPRIGELRKGAAKPETGNRPGADLKYFRFTSTNEAVVKKFHAVYENEPQSVNVFLPYATTDENFEAWQEEWGAGSLKHRCDGEYVVMIQRNGEYIQPEHGTVKCPGKCKQVGRLKVIIPELGRLAYVVALTTSIWDISEVHSNLAAYEALRGDLRGIPFILSRVPRMISTPGKDGRVRREKWLWHIEAAPEWVQAQLSVMQRQALPTATQQHLGSGRYSDGSTVDESTGEILEPDDIVDGDFDQTNPAADDDFNQDTDRVESDAGGPGDMYPGSPPIPNRHTQKPSPKAQEPEATGEPVEPSDYLEAAVSSANLKNFADNIVAAGVGYTEVPHVVTALTKTYADEMNEKFMFPDKDPNKRRVLVNWLVDRKAE